MIRAAAFLAALVGASLATDAGAVSGTWYLAGAILYSCSADGTNGGPGAYGPAYQYSTNSATSHEPLVVNGVGSAILFELHAGANYFAFDTSGLSPGAYACLEVFFDDTSSYNPPYQVGSGISGLTAIAPVAGTGFAFPDAGIVEQSYNSSGNSVIGAPYEGRHAMTLAPDTVAAFRSFVVDASIDGSFILQLPEPDAFAGAAAAVLATATLARRRAAESRRATLGRACEGSSPRC